MVKRGLVSRIPGPLGWAFVLLPAVLTSMYFLMRWSGIAHNDVTAFIPILGVRSVLVAFYALCIVAFIFIHHELKCRYDENESRLWHPYVLPLCAATLVTGVISLPWVTVQPGILVFARAVPGAFLVSIFLSPIITGPIILLSSRLGMRNAGSEVNLPS